MNDLHTTIARLFSTVYMLCEQTKVKRWACYDKFRILMLSYEYTFFTFNLEDHPIHILC